MSTKETYTFDRFLQDVHPEHLPFVMEMDEGLRVQGYNTKVELAKSGYVVSYVQPKTKKTLFNYVFRKSGMQIRLYGDHVGSYLDVLQTLPAEMAAEIDDAPACKRLLNPTACNSRCPMGYVFSIRDKQYQKCRYNAFIFPVNEGTIPVLGTLIHKEAAARAAT